MRLGLVPSLILFLSVIALTAQNGFACSFIYPPHRSFDSTEFVFVGKVTGVTNPIEFEARKNDTSLANPPWNWYRGSGLVVEATEVINTPNTNTRKFEIFQFETGGMCEKWGRSPDWFSTRYPIGSEVLVVARSDSFVGNSVQSAMRLVIDPPTGILSLIGEELPRPTAQSEFDYGILRSSSDFWRRLRLRALFEVRKDLKRLGGLSETAAKVALLKRLLLLPDGGQFIDYYPLLKEHVQPISLGDRLYQEKLELEGWKKERIEKHIECMREKHSGKASDIRHPRC